MTSILTQMAINGHFNKDTLVWKNGMSEWEKAIKIEDLQIVFNSMPPIPPQK